jgi:hypothetical protein
VDSSTLCAMPFSVQAYIDDHRLSVTTETAKDAFAKAVEWHIAERLSNVTISDGNKSYTGSEFSSVMALQQIADTVEADVVRECETARKIEKRPWTVEELQKIRMGCRKGLSARQIADLTNRRVASVKKKARELGLVPLKKSESC